MNETALGLSKDDFYDLCRQFKPDLDRAEFESDWGEFQRQKAEREAKRRVQ